MGTKENLSKKCLFYSTATVHGDFLMKTRLFLIWINMSSTVAGALLLFVFTSKKAYVIR